MTGKPRLDAPYNTHEGKGVPGDLNPDERVDVVFRCGTTYVGCRADELCWTYAASSRWSTDTVAWRRTPPSEPVAPRNEAFDSRVRKHNHYFKDVSHLDTVDVYRVLSLFNVTDQALGHAIKKLLVAGGRGAGKDVTRDVQEAVDTLQRFLEMRGEDCIEKAD